MNKNGRLIQTIRIYRQAIGMEFAIEKSAMLIMKSKKKRNNERNRTAKPRKNQNV